MRVEGHLATAKVPRGCLTKTATALCDTKVATFFVSLLSDSLDFRQVVDTFLSERDASRTHLLYILRCF